MAQLFERLRDAGFDVEATYHADAILHEDFPKGVEELEEIVLDTVIPIEELIRGGGGEAPVTQRLRRALNERGWRKQIFHIEKRVDDRTTFAQSHEVDHVKRYDHGTLALEIEWNNKDPFFDRDLENFNRLHADGAISVGVIVTRGRSFQEGIGGLVETFAKSRGIESFEDLENLVRPTRRQRRNVETSLAQGLGSFAEAWARAFAADKFGTATTHWSKLAARLARGLGSPCPLAAIGLPISRVTGLPPAGLADRPGPGPGR